MRGDSKTISPSVKLRRQLSVFLRKKTSSGTQGIVCTDTWKMSLEHAPGANLSCVSYKIEILPQTGTAFAVSGFTLSVCLYLGIKIRRWWLAAAVFAFIHSFTSILPEKSSLQSYVSMKNNSIIT